MGTLGTFDSFTTARLGIYAAQHGLRVTGNNISNINTAGYTRQRIDQISFKTGVNDRYKSMLDNHVGNGALVTGINQIRDPYLDIRYRTTATDTAYQEAKLKGLEEIASILDEVGKGGSDSDGTKGDGLLYAQLQDLAEKLRSFGASPTKDNDTLVRGSAEALTSLFRTYAGKLEQLHKDTDKDFNTNVTMVNKILTNIRDLNKSIRECEITGDNALEMRDERNRQIDELSEYIGIKTVYSMEDVGAGIQVEKLTILLGGANPDPNVETDSAILVDGLYATQLSVPEEKPVINSKFGSKNPADAALKDYLYLKADGTGTNKVDEAKKVKNDNYTVQLGELLNDRGEKWKDTKTTWIEVPGTGGEKAQYKFTVASTPTAWNDGDSIVIGGKTFTVGQDDLTLDIVKDSEQLAQFVAERLTSAEYDITAEDDQIVFTAKKIGAVGGQQGPAKEAGLELQNGDGKLTLTLDPDTKSDGEDSQPPDDPPAGVTEGNDINATKNTITYTWLSGSWYRIEVETKQTFPIALDDNDLNGKLQAQRELLTEEGEFASDNDVLIDENAAIKRGIPYYQKSFNLLAQKLAEEYNKLNTGFKIDQNGNYLDGNNEVLDLKLAGAPVNKNQPLTDAQKQELIAGGCFTEDQNGNKVADLGRWLEAKGAVPMGGPLFSNSNDGDDPSGINALNINVSYSWSHGAVQLVPKFEVLFADGENKEGMAHSTQNINANHMISLIDKPLTYNPAELIGSDASGPLLFSGSFNDMFSNMMGVQADDASVTNVKLTTSSTSLVELDSSREGVSGVDLNDEAMNMMQYQKAYSAACRLMTAIDEALDRLINNTGLAGR